MPDPVSTESHWKKPSVGIGLTVVSTLAPTLGFPLPTWLRWIGFVVGVLLILWPLLAAAYRRTRQIKLEPHYLIIIGAVGVAIFGCILAGGVTWQQISNPVRNNNVAMWSASPLPEMEGAPLAWNKQPELGWMKPTEDQVVARTITVNGINKGPEEIQLEDVYLLSGITGKRIDMQIEAADGRSAVLVPAKNTYPIPPTAPIRARTGELNGVAGIPEAEFLKEWGTLYFITEYGGKKHRMAFDAQTIGSLFDVQRPKPIPPHVTVRK